MTLVGTWWNLLRRPSSFTEFDHMTNQVYILVNILTCWLFLKYFCFILYTNIVVYDIAWLLILIIFVIYCFIMYIRSFEANCLGHFLYSKIRLQRSARDRKSFFIISVIVIAVNLSTGKKVMRNVIQFAVSVNLIQASSL